MPYEAHAGTSDGRSKNAIVPGGWQASVIAVLSAVLVGSWGLRDRGAPHPIGKGYASRIDDVSPQDWSAALDTVAGTPQQLAQLRDPDACRHRLAWVTISSAPGRQPGRIRLRSGSYLSPVFELAETPSRVALPYPAPYATGRGVISVVGATTAAVVALSPPWGVPAQAGAETRLVTWTPAAGCPGLHP